MNQDVKLYIESILLISENLKVELSSILSAANTLGMEEVINTNEEISFVRSLFNFPVHKDNAQAHAAKLAKLKLQFRANSANLKELN